MVAIVEDDFGGNPRTLCDWVKNFRIKKIQMKRKLRGAGGDLRVCAILSTALMSAEHELRRKQQERFNRWLAMQSKFDDTLGDCGKNSSRTTKSTYVTSDMNKTSNCSAADVVKQSGESLVADDEESKRKSEEISNLWKYELNGLDQFMKNISSSNSNSQNQYRAQTVAS